jgi:hypothetical protein
MYVSTGVITSDPELQGVSFSLDGGHSWTTWPEMEGIQAYGTDWVEGRIGWAGNFNGPDDPDVGGIYKYTPPTNDPPTAPIIEGKTKGDAGKTYLYGFIATDPDGDDIAEYIINWGDGTGDEVITGPFGSGVRAEAEHEWASAGDYIITAKAKDVNDAIGPEGSLPVTMPKSRILNNPFYMRLLDIFPHAFPLLRNLLGL